MPKFRKSCKSIVFKPRSTPSLPTPSSVSQTGTSKNTELPLPSSLSEALFPRGEEYQHFSFSPKLPLAESKFQASPAKT